MVPPPHLPSLPASMGCASTMLELARHCIRLAPLVPFAKGEGRPLLPIGEEIPTCVSIQRFRRISSKPLCIEDAERVEDPILFVRPCKCIEDARSLVLRLEQPSASQRNFNQLNTSSLCEKVPLRGTFVLLCVDQAARTSGPLAWSLDNLGCTRQNSSKLGSALVCTRFRTNSFFEAF